MEKYKHSLSLEAFPVKTGETHNIVFAFRYLGEQQIFSHALRDIYKTIKLRKMCMQYVSLKKWAPRNTAFFLA